MARRKESDAARPKNLLRIAEALPEVDIQGDQHRGFRVGKKSFAYYLNDHHGDGIVGLACKAIDRSSVDWDLARDLLQDAYRLQAPRRLAKQLDDA